MIVLSKARFGIIGFLLFMVTGVSQWASLAFQVEEVIHLQGSMGESLEGDYRVALIDDGDCPFEVHREKIVWIESHSAGESKKSILLINMPNRFLKLLD